MGAELLESTRERSEERHWGDSPVRESVEGDFDDSGGHDKDRSRDRSKHKSKDRKKTRREDKDHRGRGRDKSKTHDDSKERGTEVKDAEKERFSSKEIRKETKEDKGREKDHDRDKSRGKDREKDRIEKVRERKRDRERERELESEGNRGREKERVVEKGKEKEREKDRGRDRDKGKDREKEKEKEKSRDREKERVGDKNKDRDRVQVKDREREGVEDYDKERLKDREKPSRRGRDDRDHFQDDEKDGKGKLVSDYNRNRETYYQEESPVPKDGEVSLNVEGDYVEELPVAQVQSQKEMEERILKMKEQRLKNNSENGSEILSWVNKSRKLEERKVLEREKAKRRSKVLDDQDNVDEDDEEGGIPAQMELDGLAGVKVLHGIDKVLEGGSVVLTLKDQDILANGDLNEDVDILENVEIGEQKRRNEAYKAAKKTASYDDKFDAQPGEEKKMLPQYDAAAEDEGVTLDVAGRFTREAERKLQEIRRKFENPYLNGQVENLNSSIQISSDYYTPEEMLRFKKPKKKKSLRKREKLDIDALEAEARAEGLGSSDLGSRNDSKRQAAKEEEQKAEATRRTNAYQAAFAKADEASKALRMEQLVSVAKDDEDEYADVFADDADDLRKSLERARKLALKKQNEKLSAGPEAIARLASSITGNQPSDAQNSTSDAVDNKVVFTEMEEFVWGLQLDEDSQKPSHEDVFMEEDEPVTASSEQKIEHDSWTEVKDSGKDEPSKPEDKEEMVPDDTLHEAPLGKGLFGAFKLLKDRGTLGDKIDWGGRNMDKKKGKLVDIHVDEGPKEIHLERLDEFGRVLTPKEAFRRISHKFHGKGPGKMKLEKRIKSFQEDQKRKKLASSDALPESVERMREAQLQQKTPYLILSGHAKPGQTGDPRSGFTAVEKQVPGSLTPMLGDEKVENWQGIKRKVGPSSLGIQKKPKP